MKTNRIVLAVLMVASLAITWGAGGARATELTGPVGELAETVATATTGGLTAIYDPATQPDAPWHVTIKNVVARGVFVLRQVCGHGLCVDEPARNPHAFVGSVALGNLDLRASCGTGDTSSDCGATGTFVSMQLRPPTTYVAKDAGGKVLYTGACGSDLEGLRPSWHARAYEFIDVQWLYCFAPIGGVGYYMKIAFSLIPGPFTRAPGWRTPAQIGVPCDPLLFGCLSGLPIGIPALGI